MEKINKFRTLAWALITAITVSLTAPAAAKAEVVEDFTPRRVIVKRQETEETGDYSMSFYGRYEPAEETVITDGLTVMEAGEYDLYSLYYDTSVVAVEDDAPLYAMGDFVAEEGALSEALGIDSLREMGAYGQKVKVAVLDTAVEGLALAGEVSFLDEAQEQVESEDAVLHGTAVAAILSELAPMAELYSVEVLDEEGNGYYSSLLQGIYWAAENDMDVLVMSLGGESNSVFLWEALQYASWYDMVVLAAAGNEEGGSLLYPAAYPETLSVAGADKNGIPMITYADGTADLLAPGEVRLSAAYNNSVFQGSSAATPVAAAAAVLLRGFAPELSREQVMALLLNTSDGMVDAEAAVKYRMSPVYTRLTNREISAEMLAAMEEALDGILEAQAHVCKKETTYGPHTADGHQAYIGCSVCGTYFVGPYAKDPDCTICYPPAATPTPTPEPTSTPTPKPTVKPTTVPTAKPTASPVPTSTPVPTATPKPTERPIYTTPTPSGGTATPTPTEIPEEPVNPYPATPAVTEGPTPNPTATPKPTERPIYATPTPYGGTATPTPTETPEEPVNPYPATPPPTPTPTPTPLPREEEEKEAANLGDGGNNSGAFQGDPINMVLGNFYLEITDMYFPGIGDASIDLTRSYNSVDERSGLLGKGWSFAYDTHLTKKANGDISVMYASGRTLVYEKSGSSYLTPKACKDTLTKNSDGTWSLVTEDKSTYTYNASGKLTAITDKNGNSVTFTYTGGSLSKITGADGITLTVSCSGGKLNKITDPFGRSVTYSYDSKGNLIKVSGETCGTMTFTYDSHGLTSITDGNGSTYIKNVYDSDGRVVRQTDEEGREYQIIYNDKKQENTFIVLDTGAVTRYQYDENLYISRINYADGSYERFVYDEQGNRTMVRARSGYATQYAYDARGNMTSVTDALGNVYTFTYDADGNMTGALSPLGSKVEFIYDSKGNLLKTSTLLEDGSKAETVYAYDAKGRVVSVTDAEGGTTTFTYGSNSQPLSATGALGGTVKYTYDSIGRRTAIETDLGKTVYEYNSQDQITCITAPDGGVTKFVYDAIGNLTKLILPEQVEEAVEAGLSMEEAKGYTYTYDSMDRLIVSGTPEEAVSTLGYDIDGNVTEQGMPEYAGYTVEDTESYRYTYDLVGNVTKVTAPDGGITTYTYDASGNVQSVTYPDGQETGASVNYTYDALGRVTSVTDTLGVVQYRYTYDADGNLTSVTDAMGYTTWYKYNVTGNVTEVRTPKKEENGIVYYQIFKYTYNKNRQVVSAASSAEFVTKTGQPAAWDTVTYTYDAAGNVTSMKDSTGGEVQYTYDKYSQLLEQRVINGVTDPVTTAYTYNSMGSVAESEGYRYTYDLNGNLVQVNTPEGGEVRYVYDADNRLIRTEEEVQVDVLDMQENSVSIRPLEEGFEENGKGFLYMKQGFAFEVVAEFEETVNDAEIIVIYEDELLELAECTESAYGVTADTSVPGIIRLNVSGADAGDTVLCSVSFTAKTSATGTAYVAVAQESVLTNHAGTFAFSECTGVLADICLPDYNGDNLLDLRDFTLLAKQHGSSVDENTERYDLVEDGTIDDADLDYLRDFLFEGITEAEQIEAGHVADKTVQSAYTITSTMETRVTAYEYNAADQLTKVTDCNGNSVCYEYDSCGRLIKMTDQAGSVSEITYDAAGNPVKVVLPEGVAESYTYDTNGRVLTVTDSVGATISYGYDAYGRTTSITDAVGVTTSYQYDIAGNIVKNLSTGEIYCYNAYDEVVSYTDAEGNVTKVVYDAQGNVTSTTDALGNSTSYTYRKDGLLTEIKDASGAVTLYEYNNKGLVSKETDALGAVTTYEYDSENRPVKIVTPDGTVTEYIYNTTGSIIKVTATKTNGESETLNYLYALDGSLTASMSSSDILEYTYNNRGSVVSVTRNNNHQVKLSYDGNGNMTRLEELTKGVTESVTSYSYDSRGYLTKVSSEEGTLATYISRADGLLEQVTDGVGNVTKYQYDQKKQVTGLTITAADGIVLYSEANTYDGNGSLLNQNINGTDYKTESLTYTYDALDRLLSETKNGQTTNYTYDVMGNRLTKTSGDVTTAYTYDLCNKLLSETTGEEETTYSYDALGNLIQKVNSTGKTTYVYDALNQLTKVTDSDGTWQSNTYDASGIRSMITENGITTEFMTFSDLVLSGYDKNGEQTEHYYYGSSLIAAEYANNTYTDLYYYLKNSHGDIIGLTDTYSTLTEAYRYDAFGTLTNIKSLNGNGVLAEAETALSRFLYAGEQLDTTTGLYYLRARQYDTALGRFTQEDTYLGDGRNLYVYVRNNPLKYVDPSGHCGKGLGYYIESLQNVPSITNYIYKPWGTSSNNDQRSFYELLQIDAAGATNDLIIGMVYEFAYLLSMGTYRDPEAEKVRYEEAFQCGVDIVDDLNLYMHVSSMFSGTMGGTGNNAYYGGTSGQTSNALVPQITLPSGGGLNPYGMSMATYGILLPPSIINLRNQETNVLIGIGSGSGTHGVGNPVEVAGRGSTGRTIPNTLEEQMAMHQVMSNPLDGAIDLSQLAKNPIIMTDSRWPASEGWVKMSNNVNGIEIHFVYNKITGEFDDFKFK